MNKGSWLFIVGLWIGSSQGETNFIHFQGSPGGITDTTGELLDGLRGSTLTTNIYEIPSVMITVRVPDPEHELNVRSSTTTSFGINDKSTSDDVTYRFEEGEVMMVSFDRTLRIHTVDFVGFDTDSLFILEVEGEPDHRISKDDLGSFNVYQSDITLRAGKELGFYVGNSNSVIGLQAMAVTVLDETGELFLSLEHSNDWIHLTADFDGTAVTSCVLQSCTNLTSNVWNTVSGSFSADTNWSFNASNSAVFFRTVEGE